MRTLLLAVVAALAVGCVTTPPQEIQGAIQGNLKSLQLLEADLLELVPADAEPIDFSQVGGTGSSPVLYRPRDGWRILLRTYQLRAASLVAWIQGEEFDQDAGLQALVLPAIEEAKRNLPDDE